MFQTSVFDKYLETLDLDKIDKAYRDFTSHFHNTAVQKNIRGSKEEQYQEGFLRDLFVSILGYTLNPDHNFNLTTELKNIKDSKKADGGIIFDDKVSGIIELKGTNTTDLNKVENQAFGYKNNQEGCQYVIISNFEKLRFYIDNAIEHIEFNLFTLSLAQFKLLWLCLQKDNLENNLPKQIKAESLANEETVTKKLYKDYKTFRNDIFENILRNNSNQNKLSLFKATQKLLDRFLFIFFAEDRNLVPPNSIRDIINHWERNNEFGDAKPLYEVFKIYFNVLNVGREKKGNQGSIFAYNGGLFKPDPILDNLVIEDQILFAHTQNISNYDFESEVSVNILGHIFENSLNEIDEIKNELQGITTDKKDTKRKKDGVFYTPKYITKYIVDNTVGKLCEDKKRELDIKEEQYNSDKRIIAKTKSKLENKLEAYKNWLLQITICDPACGSGAFLNQALEFLITEHNYIQALETNLNKGQISLFQIESHILENNLFGVDINEESIDIAKLSLWLRTAEKGRKLTTLTNNIKCGNSLIDDPEVAGDKAFDWQKEFPQVFDPSTGSGAGFDVIIGNPPYVRVQGLKQHYFEATQFYENTFKSATGNYDIYVLFMEKCHSLINSQGLISFILPHKFLISDFGNGIREFFTKNKAVQKILHFGSDMVFADASTYTCIIELSHNNKELLFKALKSQAISEPFDCETIDYKSLSSDKWNLADKETTKLLTKLNEQPLRVKDVFAKIFQGIATSADAIYLLQKTQEGLYSKSLDKIVEVEQGLLKPLLKGENISRYEPLSNNYNVIFPYLIIEGKAKPMSEDYVKTNFPKGYEYLKANEKELRGREKGRFDNPKEWFLFSRKQGLNGVEQPKIITPEIAFKSQMSYDSGVYYHNTKCYSFILKPEIKEDYKYWLCLLNSSLMWVFLKNTGYELRGGYYAFKTKFLEPFPLPRLKNLEAQTPFIEKAEKMLNLNKELQDIKRAFVKDLELEKASKKLQNFEDLSFEDFIKELAKQKKIKFADKLEERNFKNDWESLFQQDSQKALALKNTIHKTDKEIDQMVYELYGLTEQEIAIVESN